MADGSTGDREWSGRLTALVFVLVTVVFLARPLLGLGSLLPTDIVDGAAPWRADPLAAKTPHNPFLSDTLSLHVHFASIANDFRAGTVSWWDRSIGGGIPTLKAGFSPLLWLYALVPAWYAPGLVAAARTLLAAGLTHGFLRELRVGRAGATVGGVAYALSGFMVGWAGWPQSNVAAFLPGLFWAVERLIRRPRVAQAVPLAFVVAAMVVSNFPLVTAYGLVAAAGYGVWRVCTDPCGSRRPPGVLRRFVRPGAIALWGLVLAGALSSLHILAFGEYFNWADTSARERIPADTSIGSDFLLSILFPRPFGAPYTGEPFWREGQNWVETQSYAGLAVVVLAAVALITGGQRSGGSGDAAVRAHAVRALWFITIVGAWVSYVGGPPTELFQSLPFLGQNSVGRARVVINLALAMLAGLGVQAWLDAHDGVSGVDVLRGLRTAVIGAGVLVVSTLPVWWRWVGDARERGLLVETVQSLLVPLAAGAIMVGLLWRYRPASRRSARRAVFGAGAVGLVAVELLWFALPVATVVDRDRAGLVTDAHRAVAEVLGPGERLGADARTFFANTAQLTGIDDMRGHLLTPAGWREIYRALDPDHFRPPGSVTNPWFSDVDLLSPALDRLAVRVWAADPAVSIVGTRADGPPADAAVGINTDAVEGVSSQVVPPGGLRAIEVEVVTGSSGELRAEMLIAGRRYFGTAQLDLAAPGPGPVDIGLVDVSAPPGSPIEVNFTVESGEPVSLRSAGGVVTFATVAAGDGLRLIRSGDVSLYERPGVSAARLVYAVNERDGSAGVEAQLGDLSVGQVPVGSDTGLPTSVPPGAEGSAWVLSAEGGTVVIEVDTTVPALVVVSQTNYPGWTATVDGRAATIVEVDGAFPALLVEPGSSVVRLEYRPSDLSLALWLTALGLTGAGASWWFSRSRSSARRGELSSPSSRSAD